MKPSPARFLPALVATLLAAECPRTFGATEAMTDPVGFLTLNIGGGSVASPKLSLISPTLMRAVDWQGAIESLSGATINVANAPWTAGAYDETVLLGEHVPRYFVEVTTGPKAGAWADIVSNTEGALTLDTSFTGLAVATDSIRIRKHVTISDMFGAANSAGLQDSVEPATADQIFVYDGANSPIYWFYNGSQGGSPGWFDFSWHPADNKIIAPNQGVVIKRQTSGNVSFVTSGTVKTGNTFVPIVPGLNVVGAVSAQGVTLANSGLFTGNLSTGLNGSNEPATADQVTIYSLSPPQQTTYFYYNPSNGVAAGWYDYGWSPAGSTVILPGSSIVISRATGPAFNWVVPSPMTF